MTDDEAKLALGALRQAWSYTPMTDIQARQFERLFRGHQVSIVRDVLDDLIRIGVPRPGPAEMGELLRQKCGRGPAGQRARRHGEQVNFDVPISPVPDAVREALDKGKQANAEAHKARREAMP